MIADVKMLQIRNMNIDDFYLQSFISILFVNPDIRMCSSHNHWNYSTPRWSTLSLCVSLLGLLADCVLVVGI